MSNQIIRNITRKILAWMVAAWICGTCTTQAASPLATTFQVTADGNPLEGVDITVTKAVYEGRTRFVAEPTLTTDNDGEFVIDPVSVNIGGFLAGHYRFVPSKPGYSFSTPEGYLLLVPKDNTGNHYEWLAHPPNFEFEAVESPIGGRLVNEADHVPVDGVRVRLVQNAQGRGEVLTDNQGRFSFAARALGDYTLEISMPGAFDMTEALRSIELQTTRLDVRAGDTEANIDVDYVLHGRVRTLRGRSVSGATIVVRDPDNNDLIVSDNVQTGQDGRFAIAGLTQRSGDAFARYTIEVVKNNWKVTSPNPRTRTLGTPNALDFVAGPALTGRITQGTDGLAGVTLLATDSNGVLLAQTNNNSQGHYTLVFDNATEVTVMANKTGFTFVPPTRAGHPGNGVSVDFTATGNVEGRITFDDGSPLVGITVHAYTNSSPLRIPTTTTTGENGAYRFLALPGDEVTIEPQPPEGIILSSPPMPVVPGTGQVDFEVIQSPPTITPLADQFMEVNGQSPALSFRVGDRERNPALLQVSYESSDPDVVPNRGVPNVVFTQSASGDLRTVQVVPAPDAAGNTTITLTVEDGEGGTASTRFNVFVGVGLDLQYLITDMEAPPGFEPLEINDPGDVLGFIGDRSLRTPASIGIGLDFIIYGDYRLMNPYWINAQRLYFWAGGGSLDFIPLSTGAHLSMKQFADLGTADGRPLPPLGAPALSLNNHRRVSGSMSSFLFSWNDLWHLSPQGVPGTPIRFDDKQTWPWPDPVFPQPPYYGWQDDPGYSVFPSIALDINNSNQVIVTKAEGSFIFTAMNNYVRIPDDEQATSFSETLLASDFHMLELNDAGDILGVNATNGNIALGSVTAPLTLRTFTLTETRGTNLPTAMNNLGIVVGRYELGGFRFDPSTTNFTHLDLLPFDINDRGDIVGTMNGRAVLYREHSGGTYYDLNDVAVSDEDWVLTRAMSINNEGVIVGKGILNDAVGSFVAKMATAAGQAIPFPPGTTRQQPNIRILERPSGFQTTDYFYWSPADEQLFALLGDVRAEITWHTENQDGTGPETTNTIVRTVWPTEPQRHVIGAPVELEPPAGENFPYSFFQVANSSAGVTSVDPATKVFKAELEGYTILQYHQSKGQPLNPQTQPVHFEIVRSDPWDAPVFPKPPAPPEVEIGQAVQPPFGSLAFSGANDVVTMPRFEGFPSNEITVELWAKNSGQPQGETLISYASTNSFNDLILINPLDWDIWIDGSRQPVNGAPAINDDQWHHYAVTWKSEGGELRFFIDGTNAFATTGFKTNSMFGQGGTLVLGQEQDAIGDRYDPAQAWSGRIAQVRVWNEARTETQIRDNLIVPMTGSESNLVSHWPLNDGVGSLARDLGVNRNHGRLSPETTWSSLPPPGFSNQANDYPGRNGYVLSALAFYDGEGPDRAYDRAKRTGPIIPVNKYENGMTDMGGDFLDSEETRLIVAWYRRNRIGVAWPDVALSYLPEWPDHPETLLISSLKDSPLLDAVNFPDKRIYHQADWTRPGFNPNEEHAGIFEDKVTALRNDLNGILDVSQPYTLLKYRNPFSGDWQMKVFAVVAQDAEHPFRYPQQAAQEIQPPFPLHLLNLCDQTEVVSGPLTRDYKGKIYAYAAGEGLANREAVIRYFYPLQPSYFFDLNFDRIPDELPGTCVPWLNQINQDQEELPLDVTYDIRWPNDIPSLQIGSTLTSAREGLPEIFGQAAVRVAFEGANPVYTVDGQRHFPDNYALNSSVRLYDPISERRVPLPNLPDTIKTELEQTGSLKNFPDLPYHLRARLVYDDQFGQESLIYRGFTVFKDQPPSDPLLLPNVMTPAERDRALELSDNAAWTDTVRELYDLTRNPNGIDLVRHGIPSDSVMVGLITEYTWIMDISPIPHTGTFTATQWQQFQSVNANRSIVETGQRIVTEPLGGGPKALTAALPLSEAAADLMLIDGSDQAVQFDGVDDRIALDDVKGMPTGSVRHTIEAWVRVDSLPNSGQFTSLLRLGGNLAFLPAGTQIWAVDETGNARIGALQEGGSWGLTSFPFPNADWIHLATTFDGATLRAYTNGVEAATVTNLFITFDDDVPFVLAEPWPGTVDGIASQPFGGAIAEVRVWDHTRTASQISRFKDVALRGSEGGLLVHWRADEGAGMQLTDASGHGNHGSLENLPAWINSQEIRIRQPNGYVTLVVNDDPDLPGLPVTFQVIQVDVTAGFFAGDLRVIASDNVFDERLTLRHSGDFGFQPDQFEFEWYAHNGGDPFDIADETGDPASGWGAPFFMGPDLNSITLGEGGKSSVLTISDNRWIMRFRPVPGSPMEGLLGTGWSDWAGAPNKVPKEAMLAEGWIKRVTQALNAFDARTDDFRNSEANTFASLLVSAGRRYEGDIAFNPDADNINTIGLIEAYQTVLHRGANRSINNNIDNGPANDALLLASSKIADLYMLLGNEAYSDAVDPTIGFTTSDGQAGTLAPSIFSFQNQADSLLEEELGLLRGLDQNLGAPAYNRFPWNFTHGNGQLAYQQIYNIFDTQTRNPITGQIVPPDGFIDVNDAATLYPQGHGDAWGHYLTAATVYYDLLGHTNFNWRPRTEFVLLAGVPVEVDYEDERKFASIAAAKAKAGSEIVNLTYRLHYVDDPAGQWQGYKDTNPDRAWGVDEWGRRAGQGAYFDWVTANAILPAQDPDPSHDGIQKVDRTTVPELREIASEFQAVQSQLDNADIGLNPVGLAKGAVSFDIDPVLLSLRGQGHFDQIYERARNAMENAVTVFNHANDLTRNLRRTQDSQADFARNVDAQEQDYRNRIIKIFGYPHSGKIGPGNPYPSGYDGPDLFFYNYVDVPTLTGDASREAATFQAIDMFLTNTIVDAYTELGGGFGSILPGEVRFEIAETGWPFVATPGFGSRRAPGEIQLALSDMLQHQRKLEKALREYDNHIVNIESALAELKAKHDLGDNQISRLNAQKGTLEEFNKTLGVLKAASVSFQRIGTVIRNVADAAKDAVPDSALDMFSAVHASISTTAEAVATTFEVLGDIADVAENSVVLAKESVPLQTEIDLATTNNFFEVQQGVNELQGMIAEEAPMRVELYALAEAIQQAQGRYLAKLQEGLRLIDERTAFRRRTAGFVSENRYRDMSFRVFRNDAIQKYRAQFDVAARYAYLAATAYDYETTMLGNQAGAGRQFLTDIVRQRALGEWINGQPVVGRHGLADTLGRLAANWNVLKGQLGINNPEHEDAFFSLRHELFRHRPLDSATPGEIATSRRRWIQTLKRHQVHNLWDIPEFRRFCRPFAPEAAGPQPGLVIPFSTTVTFGLNLFGWPLSAQDGAYDSSRFATKVRSSSVLLENYPTSLSRTPRIYLVPVGTDILRAARGNTLATREFNVVDQKIPEPFPIGFSDVNNPEFIPENDSLSGSFIEVRRFSTFKAFPGDVEAFDPVNNALSESRLIGRSVWNTQWMIIIPGGTFLFDAEEGLDEFIHTIEDITLYFRTYAASGN